MDAIKFLTRQHREVEALFAEYERAPQRGRELFGRIERAIVPHAIIEEQLLYPMIRERVANGERLAEHAIHEHADVEDWLNRISALIDENAPFELSMQKVIRAVREHVREEEDAPGLFSLLRATMTQRELQTLGRSLQVAWEMTPTRAHPMAPDRPPANLLLGLPLAAIDRVRDRISGRAEASAPAERRVRRAPPRKRRAATRKRGKAAKSKRRPARRQAKRATTRARRGVKARRR